MASEMETDVLNEEQKRAFQYLQERRSFFLTGPGGCGKSFLIERFRQYLEERGSRFEIVALTGIAAVNIQAKTLQSLFRWLPTLNLETMDYEDYKALIEKDLALTGSKRSTEKPKWLSWYLLKKLRQLEFLIIDEVSMMSGELFRRLDYLCRRVRGNDRKPFGALRMILIGDFFQLPPVASKEMIFESKLFYETIEDIVRVHQSYRQADKTFADLLQRVRNGTHTAEDLEVLQSRVGANVSRDGIEPTLLYAKNREVDRVNLERLQSLDSPAVVIRPRFHVASNYVRLAPLKMDAYAYDLKKLEEDMMIQDSLKVGAQVMLTANLNVSSGLCNGSRGVIVGFTDPKAGRDKDSIFQVRDWPDSGLPCAYPFEALPIVKFRNGLEKVIPMVRATRLIKEDDQTVQLNGWFIPLKLAWATTIHKSQGLSLDCVQISLDDSIFAPGQAYVALSRVRTLEGLSLTCLKPNGITVNDKVALFDQYSYAFNKELYTT